MGTVIESLVRDLVEVVVDALLTKTGRGLWALVGVKPHDIVSMFSGMIFWIVVGVFTYAMMRG